MAKKILIIDDVQAVRNDIRKYLCPPVSAEDMMMQLIMQGAAPTEPLYEIDEASQGVEGVEITRFAFNLGKPYDIAIIDMTMPPGIDGGETIRRIREFDRGLYIIVCTAFTDIKAEDLASHNAGVPPLIIHKPITIKETLLDAVNSGRRLD